MKGIDVSVYQKGADWKKIASGGIQFAMIKASQGGKTSAGSILPFRDSAFTDSVKGAHAAGIRCGAYHYLTGTTEDEAKAEADFFISVISPYKNLITYPCAADMEDMRYTKMSKDANTAVMKAFCERVASAGFIPMLYTNRAFSKYYLNMDKLKDYDVWFALYRSPRSNENKPVDVPRITIWQWSAEGGFDGINGKVDVDEGYFDYSADPARLSVGDKVKFITSATSYYAGGLMIPDWVKKSVFRIAKTEYAGKMNMKNGDACVLLGARVVDGKDAGSLMTWSAVRNLIKLE